MALSAQQIAYYMSCIHELNRAMFFGDCPNYVNQMDAEIKRLEATDPDYDKIKKKDLADYSKVKPYGEKKGSTKSEKVVTTRTGITNQHKDKVKA